MTIVDDDCGARARQRSNPIPDPCRRRVRVNGKERDPLAASTLFDVRPIDPSVGTDKAARVLDDQYPRPYANDLSALPQYELDQSRVLLSTLPQVERLGRRLDALQIDETALGLRDDLLSQDDDVARRRLDPVGAKGCNDEICDGITGSYRRKTPDREEREHLLL